MRVSEEVREWVSEGVREKVVRRPQSDIPWCIHSTYGIVNMTLKPQT